MWKYVAFVILIIFSVPAVFGESTAVDSSSSVTTTPHVTDTTTTITVTTTATTAVATEESSQNTTVSAAVTETTAETTTNASETTSVSTVTTTNVPVTTTSAPPPTTVLPPPAVGKYAIKDDENKTCLRVEMALRVDISNPHVLYNFPLNASDTGSECNATDHSQILKLTDPHDDTHSLTFIFVQENKKNYVQNISFSYGPLEVKTSGAYFSASEDKSYLCNAETSISVDNVTLIFSSVHIQAFGAETFGLAEECAADDKVGDIVPIAVGCALAALVVIVLIAYLVGRRRSRQRGYQSV